MNAFTHPDYGYLSKKTGIKNLAELKERLLKKTDSLNLKNLAQDVSPFLFSKNDENRVLYFRDFVKGMKA